MTTQNTVATVLDGALRPVRSQLELAASQLAGIPHASVLSATSLLEQARVLCIEQYNAEVDDFNELIDEHEALQGRLTTAELALISSREKLAEAELSEKTMKAESDQYFARNKLLHADLNALRENLAKYQSMNPDRMKSQIARLKEDIDESKKIRNQQLTEIRRLKNDIAETKSKLSSMTVLNTELTDHCSDMQRRLEIADGNTDPRTFGGHGVDYYFYTFQFGLKLSSPDPDIIILNDLEWHVEVRTTHGICLIISVNEWTAPVFPFVSEIKNTWPDGLTPALTAHIRDLLENTHAHLVRRAEWAETVLVGTLPLKDQYLDQLSSAGIHTLYDIVRRTPSMLAEAVKGFGMPTARQVHSKCVGLVRDWEKQHREAA
ncbi:hypothetical protein PMPD1_2506 [Paramixta manurensis]|uniref:Uncharacterized protein n=1 Tax=Paramixta manurensis TaxID=2740817 RepID=A0A6M8U9N2_9GAMM|nr:hypothetical protein PMPD1_2506 [Erwiniaceae bacterium PD-1]